MTLPKQTGAHPLRMGVEELKTRLLSGRLVTVLDCRNDQAWESSPVKIRDAIRIQSSNWNIDRSWPKDRYMVVY